MLGEYFSETWWVMVAAVAPLFIGWLLLARRRVPS